MNCSEFLMDRIKDKIQCNPTVKLTKGETYPFVGIDRITSGNRDIAIADKEVYSGQSCSKFRKGDTIMARITPCLENGKIAQYNLDSEIAMGSTELFVFREIENISDNDYIYYLISTDYVRNNAVNSMTGASGRQRADIKFIGKLKWNFPDYDVQCKIGKVLSTYDDLIEKNNRKIEILQDMAEELYKEWFVRFRFPGYKTAKFTDGIPDGWEIKQVKDFGQVETGKTPSTEVSAYYGSDIPFVKTPDMHNNMWTFETEEMLSIEGSNSQIKKLLPVNSIMVSCIGTGGVVSINSQPSHTNQQINSIILNDINNLEWLYYTCITLKPTILLFGATGATMTNLSKGKFEKLKVLYPGEELIELYHNKTAPIFTNIKNLMYSNKCLKQQRDLLLPRLMSGKLEVKVS